MSIVEADVVVAGLGPGGSTALARLAQAGVNAVGLEARGEVGDRWNMVLANARTRTTLNQLEFGKKFWRDATTFSSEIVSLRGVERRMRGAASSEAVDARYQAGIQSVEKLDDGTFAIVPVGVDHAIHARYLIDGTGGRMPLPEGLAVALEPRPGIDRFVSSLWEFEDGPQHFAKMVVGPNSDKLQIIVARTEDTGIQLHTRLKAAPVPDDLASFDAAMSQLAGISGQRVEQPSIIEINPALAADARRGNMLLTGDGISRVHPGTTEGMNIAVSDGVAAANAVIKALKHPDAAERTLNSYADNAMREHTFAMKQSQPWLYNPDGTRVVPRSGD
jgi:flavin-dependent dehydrogenase